MSVAIIISNYDDYGFISNYNTGSGNIVTDGLFFGETMASDINPKNAWPMFHQSA